MLTGLLKRLSGLARILMVSVVGLGCSQLSTFIHHYHQNLAGRVAEARREVVGITMRANEAGLAPYAYIDVFMSASNPIFNREGEAMNARIDRARRLDEGYHALTQVGPVMRPIVFALNLDPEIAADAWRHFKPALPLDTDSLAYTGAGMLLALLLYELIKGMVGGLLRWVGGRHARRVTATPH